jgi:hypothetical protein
VPAAFRTAANRLRPGDIMLIELHRVGPRGRYLPMEFWPDEFAAIRYAVTRGVIVVEAGGNGGENLDDPFYNNRPAGFPASWKNPFNPANPNSGAVMVGAGAPPPGTRNAREQSRSGSITARFLQLWEPTRCSGLGPRGHHNRVRGPPRGSQSRSVVYGPV